MKRRAFIGDVHGCPDELLALLSKLAHESIDEICHTGDLLDRGPDSGAVVQICVERKIKGVMGNHESTVLKMRNQILKGHKHKNVTEKHRTIESIRHQDWAYLEKLPIMYAFDDINTILVHGGVLPNIPLYKQPFSICCMQMIKPWAGDATRWWGYDHIHERTEEENRADGWVRWYEVCNHEEIIVYGHSVYEKPFRYNNTIGVDTGCVYGGELSAVILPDWKYISVSAKKAYFPKRDRN